MRTVILRSKDDNLEVSEPPDSATDSDRSVSVNLATALTALFENLFSARLVGPALIQIGRTLGDKVKLYRLKNLMRLNEKLDKVIAARGIDRHAMADVALSLGLPFLERASYQSRRQDPTGHSAYV